jgi:hypothetical protein
MAEEFEKKAEKGIEDLTNFKARENEIDYDRRCTYDVGAKTTTPGGADGKYVRQCLRYSLFNVEPPFCHQHAKKSLLLDVIKNKSEYLRLKGTPILTSAGEANGIYDPFQLKISTAEYDGRIMRKSKRECVDLINKPTVTGGLFGREAAICSALINSKNLIN